MGSFTGIKKFVNLGLLRFSNRIIALRTAISSSGSPSSWKERQWKKQLPSGFAGRIFLWHVCRKSANVLQGIVSTVGWGVLFLAVDGCPNGDERKLCKNGAWACLIVSLCVFTCFQWWGLCWNDTYRCYHLDTPSFHATLFLGPFSSILWLIQTLFAFPTVLCLASTALLTALSLGPNYWVGWRF